MKGSCAFEHVFLGEVKRGVVKGFHNWLFFLMQEQKGEVRTRTQVQKVARISLLRYSFEYFLGSF